MSERAAIALVNVVKAYRLEGPREITLGSLFGLRKASVKGISEDREYIALNDVSLTIAKGERIGMVGRNGAGKTTLLKLLCGNFAPTSGTVRVNGAVQALMSMGTGFHPDHTGRRNAEMSLKYNALSAGEQAAALEDIEEFCELGPFFDQPFKVYSLGMQARLMFAVATAVRPEILVIDEVLGAGDSYFIAKSKLRVDRLVKSGCTMILVSHSMSQILELCTRAVWLESGRIQMDGDAFLVVKAYEEYMHGSIAGIQKSEFEQLSAPQDQYTESEKGAASVHFASRALQLPEDLHLQEPRFLPHAEVPYLPAVGEVDPRAMMHQAPGGISRWDSKPGVKVCGFSVVTERGLSNDLVTFRPAAFVVTLLGEVTGHYELRYGLAIHDYLGNCLTRLFSPMDEFQIGVDQYRQIRILLNPNQLGPGSYVVGVSVLEYGPLEMLNSTERYDLLSRSFVININLPDSLSALDSHVLHTAEWQFNA